MDEYLTGKMEKEIDHFESNGDQINFTPVLPIEFSVIGQKQIIKHLHEAIQKTSQEKHHVHR